MDSNDIYTIQGKKSERRLDDQKIKRILDGNTCNNTGKRNENMEEEQTNMIKKFHFMIIHLQNELAKKVFYYIDLYYYYKPYLDNYNK